MIYPVFLCNAVCPPYGLVHRNQGVQTYYRPTVSPKCLSPKRVVAQTSVAQTSIDRHQHVKYLCNDRTRPRECSQFFFKSILLSTSCLHSLLPPPRDPELLFRLRAPSKYPRISNRTKKYQSFTSYALAHYQ